MVSLTTQHFHAPWKGHSTNRIRGCGVRSWYWLWEKRYICLATARTRNPNHPAHSLFATPATLRSARISCIMHSTLYSHLTLLVSISHTMSGVECKSQRSVLCRSLQLLLTSSALGPDVLHSTQFCNSQLTFLHLTASEAAFRATAPESKWVFWFIEM